MNILLYFFMSFLSIGESPGNDSKAIVYVYSSEDDGVTSDFTFFVNDQVYGQIENGKYLKLHLESGNYVFWTKGDRFSYLKAKLVLGKTYAIDAVIAKGKWLGKIQLQGVSQEDNRKLYRLNQLLDSEDTVIFDTDQIASETESLQNTIRNGLAKFDKMIANKATIHSIDMPVELENVSYDASKDPPVDLIEIKEVTENDPDKVYKLVQEIPLFAGCDYSNMKTLAEKKACSDNRIITYVVQNLEYPRKARKKGTQGRLFVRFIIEKDGKVSDPDVLYDPGNGCGDAALKLVKNFPRWIPGKMDGEPVRVLYTLPLTFKLEGKEKKQKSNKK